MRDVDGTEEESNDGAVVDLVGDDDDEVVVVKDTSPAAAAATNTTANDKKKRNQSTTTTTKPAAVAGDSHDDDPRTRRVHELQVGKYHTVEIIVHIKRVDLQWYNRDKTVWKEIKELLQEMILPRMFQEEMEEFYRDKFPHKFPEQAESSTGGIGVENIRNKRKNDGIGGATGNNKKGKRGGKNQQSLLSNEQQQEQQQKLKEYKKKLDKSHYAFGKNIQLRYRLEPISDGSLTSSSMLSSTKITSAPTSVTLLYSKKKMECKKKEVVDDKKDKMYSSLRFDELVKLSHKVIISCFRNDETSDGFDQHQSQGETFSAEEKIPLSSIFRSPPEGFEYYDDD